MTILAVKKGWSRSIRMKLEFRSVLGPGSRIEVSSVDNIDTVKLLICLYLTGTIGI